MNSGWSHVINCFSNGVSNQYAPLLMQTLTLGNGNECDVLIDTGSQVSIAREDMIPELVDWKFKAISLRSVDGKPLYVLGSAILQATMDGVSFSQEILVVHNVKHKFLLGMDFVSSKVESINFQTKKLTFKQVEETQGSPPISVNSNSFSGMEVICGNIEIAEIVMTEKAVKVDNIKSAPCCLTVGTISLVEELRSLPLMLISEPQVISAGIMVPLYNLEEEQIPLEASDFKLSSTAIDDIPVQPQKELPQDWESFPNVDTRVVGMLQDYETALKEEVPPIDLPEIIIDTGEATPQWSAPYSTSEQKRALIRAQCEEWLKTGIISESKSPWASPVVLVTQQTINGNTKNRLCGNFKKVNNVLKRQNFPLPRADDLFDEMRGSTVFSIIDLKAAYLQLPLREEDKEIKSHHHPRCSLPI